MSNRNNYSGKLNKLIRNFTPIEQIPSDYSDWDCEKKYIGIDKEGELIFPITPKNINLCTGFKEI